MQGSQQPVKLDKLLKIFHNMEDKMTNQNIIKYNETNPENDKYFKQQENDRLLECTLGYWTPEGSHFKPAFEEMFIKQKDLESLISDKPKQFISFVYNDEQTLIIQQDAIFELTINHN